MQGRPIYYSVLVAFLALFPLSTAVSGWPLLGIAKQALLALLLITLIHELIVGLPPSQKRLVSKNVSVIALILFWKQQISLV